MSSPYPRGAKPTLQEPEAPGPSHTQRAQVGEQLLGTRTLTRTRTRTGPRLGALAPPAATEERGTSCRSMSHNHLRAGVHPAGSVPNHRGVGYTLPGGVPNPQSPGDPQSPAGLHRLQSASPGTQRPGAASRGAGFLPSTWRQVCEKFPKLPEVPILILHKMPRSRPCTKWQMAHDTMCEMSRIANPESRWVVAREWEGGGDCYRVKGFPGLMEKFWNQIAAMVIQHPEYT